MRGLKPEKGERRAKDDGRGELGSGDLEGRGEAPAHFGLWRGEVETRKTRMRVKTGRSLGVVCWPPHLTPVLQVAIKVIPRNRVLGWSPLVSIFGDLPDLATPSLMMGSCDGLTPLPF